MWLGLAEIRKNGRGIFEVKPKIAELIDLWREKARWPLPE
jgi:hypothetical protein